MLNKFESGEYKKMNDPALLMDDDVQNIHSPEHAQFFGYDQAINRWSAPFIMGAINSKVVYGSASEMKNSGAPYAQSIAYSEHSSLGKWYNPLPFLVVTMILMALTFLGPRKWFRTFLKKIMPAPGEGPSEAQIENGYFKMHAIAKDSENKKASLKMSYPGDPGNKSTVFFLCESALCMAEDEQAFSQKSGFLTPVTTFGDTLVNRLTARGLNIEKVE